MVTEVAQTLLDKAVKALREKGVPATCPRCGQNNWAAETLGYLVITDLSSSALTLPPPLVPVLSLTCLNCGFLVLHNLKVLGVMEEK